VLGVNPGPVATDRIISLMKTRATATLGDESRWEELTRRFPLGRAARVAEIADTIVFLASDRASYTSGTIITIDGGISARNSM
jgi:NAD(P)-dependent dehydrogenase (short-subunit alcohol dehydrogenase family)